MEGHTLSSLFHPGEISIRWSQDPVILCHHRNLCVPSCDFVFSHLYPVERVFPVIASYIIIKWKVSDCYELDHPNYLTLILGGVSYEVRIIIDNKSFYDIKGTDTPM